MHTSYIYGRGGLDAEEVGDLALVGAIVNHEVGALTSLGPDPISAPRSRL